MAEQAIHRGIMGRSDEIKDAIADILGNSKGDTDREEGHIPKSPVPYRIKEILLLSTKYDYFILEEEGRLNALFRTLYDQMERGYIPKIIHAEDENSTISLLKKEEIDILIIFNPTGEMDIFTLTRDVREEHPDLPIVLMGRNTPELNRIAETDNEGTIDWVFTWTGDGEIFLSIIQFIEDIATYDDHTLTPGMRKILIVDSSPQFYSRYLSESYQVIWEHMETIMREDLTRSQRLSRRRGRPHVLIARTSEEAAYMYDPHRENMLCLVTDIGQQPEEPTTQKPKILLAAGINEGEKHPPILMLSQDPDDEVEARESGADFIQKGSPKQIPRYRDFIKRCLGPTELILQNDKGEEITRASSMKSLEKALWTIQDTALEEYTRNGDLIRWLSARMEFELADIFKGLIVEETNMEDLRKKLIGAMGEHKRALLQGTVTRFSRKTYGPRAKFSRIGRGAMGGKARGLAFMDKTISTYLSEDTLPGLSISIPRTVVLCSDIFNSFLKDNNLLTEGLYDLTDERIAVKFMEADLPAIVLGDLRSFVRETRVPIVVRSSSLLEDALLHPFAGVYASLLLPNESWETDLRFQELCNAVKYVFASVFFQKARTYMETTPNTPEDEEMAVIIQELVGHKYGDVFYPTISGVAKSFDYYPSGPCKSTDGVANMALGLGKAVVEGGTSFRFCPVHPKTPKYGTVEELMRQSQTGFFAVDLTSYVNIVHRDEDSALVKLDLETAERHGSLDQLASTYSPRDDRLYPGTGREGARIIDFAPILQLGTIPLPQAIRLLLRISEIAIGTPVEIEFALNISLKPSQPAVLYLLQTRSMLSTEKSVQVEIGHYDEQDVLCYTEDVLGNGIIDDILDIVYVKPDDFEMSKSMEIVPQIRKINKKLLENKRPYILIGPGRWGSTDQWLGIPVAWSDIAGASIIVETPVKERIIDPSQGSHFFHNMISARTGYFTIKNIGDGGVDWDWLKSIPTSEETEILRHIRLQDPVEARMDGSRRQGVILKPRRKENKETK